MTAEPLALGCYWVRLDGSDEWFVAQFNGAVWLLPGVAGDFASGQLAAVGERVGRLSEAAIPVAKLYRELAELVLADVKTDCRVSIATEMAARQAIEEELA